MLFKSAVILLMLALAPRVLATTADNKSLPKVVEFNRDIRPIFSDTCFKCHGPDSTKRKAKLRLDTRDGAFSMRDKITPFVPGDLSKSEAWRRITATNTDDLMPPADSGIKLTDYQIKLIGLWIRQGAKFSEHWSFIPPVSPALPKIRHKSWPKNQIDYFVLARLEQEELKPCREADRATLIRRVTFDLTGLPPTLAELDAFVHDKNPNAYEKVVDRLLHSPHYGERMALDWLDAARFADTHGYHIDAGRDMTRWRQWVIDAFNRNEPFDQFTIEQLAGDLLPNATLEQKIASGFNRNHMINFEGGAIPEEYHAAYIIDRVNTTGTVWLGLTVGCAQCHDHKYDPISQKDYYRLFAFFNNVPENGLDGAAGNAQPVLAVPNADESTRLAQLKSALADAEANAKKTEASADEGQARWEQDIKTNPPPTPAGLVLHFPLNGSLVGHGMGGQELTAVLNTTNAARWVDAEVGQALAFTGKEPRGLTVESSLGFERTNAFSTGGWVKPGAHGGALLGKMDETNQLRGFDLLISDGKLYFELVHSLSNNCLRIATKTPLPKEEWSHVFATYDGSGKASGVKLYANGTAVATEVMNDNLSNTITNAVPLSIGSRSTSGPLEGSLADVRIYDRSLSAEEVTSVYNSRNLLIAAIDPAKRSEKERTQLKQYFRQHHFPALAEADKAVEAARNAEADYERQLPTTMVMVEADKPHDTFVLTRGQYDQHGEKVTPAVPASLPALPAGAPANRLGLAEWLVSAKQPLTSRVIVNRYWQLYFGTGIVKTVEDFGSQGEWPSHPELLDWLATEFVRSGWDVRKLQKLIVMSATYRQSSYVSPELAARDPENRLLARGPRFRLPAEFIRDQALAVSGLLDDEIAGRSVMPYQPAGLWEELMSREDGKKWSAQTYTQSHGRDLYRRTMYTFWKRTSPPPTLATFDAPDRETCTVRRPRTNTPLQALILMNDPTYMEASRKLAERMMLEAKTDEERVTLAYRLTLARAPDKAEANLLLKLQATQLARYRSNNSAAQKLLAIGETDRNAALDQSQLAAWTMVASTILNLDETVTKN